MLQTQGLMDGSLGLMQQSSLLQEIANLEEEQQLLAHRLLCRRLLLLIRESRLRRGRLEEVELQIRVPSKSGHWEYLFSNQRPTMTKVSHSNVLKHSILIHHRIFLAPTSRLLKRYLCRKQLLFQA